MAYKVWQTGDQVQGELDDVEFKTEVATQTKNGYMSARDKTKLDGLGDLDYLEPWEIDQIWASVEWDSNNT